MARQRAIVVGGGLAGMTAAYELLKNGIDVLILEASNRLGGKAGADKFLSDSLDDNFDDSASDPNNHMYIEPGFHFFLGWYDNTFRIMKEIGVYDDLIGLDKTHIIRRGGFKQGTQPILHTLYGFSSISAIIKTVFNNLLPSAAMILAYFFMLDLGAHHYKRRRRYYLDRVSLNGILRSRRYANDDVATFHQQSLMKTLAIPSYEISSHVISKLVRMWIRSPSPLFSMLNGNLQEKFIIPYMNRLMKWGAVIRYENKVVDIEITDGRVTGVMVENGEGRFRQEAELIVLATPPEATIKLIKPQIEELELMARAPDKAILPEIARLRTAPMATMTLFLDRKIPLMPSEPVILYDSAYSLSLIDVSQHWAEVKSVTGNTVLSIIAANFEPLMQLSNSEIVDYLVRDLQDYVPITMGNIERCYLQKNLTSPLFLNTVGAWHFRPESRTSIENLYVAGEYCKTFVDISSMEGAVMSGLNAVAEFLEDHENSANATRAIIPKEIPWTPLFLTKWLLIGPMLGLNYLYLFKKWLCRNVWRSQEC